MDEVDMFVNSFFALLVLWNQNQKNVAKTFKVKW